MSIQLISVSHKTASLSVRSCFALTEEMQKKYMRQVTGRSGIEECIVVATCNRLEIYLYGADRRQRDIFTEAQRQLFQYLELPQGVDGAEYLRFYEGKKAVEHLFLVASGLDSMVIGEDQILGQVKDAQQQAVELGTAGLYLHTCFRHAITAAKRVKTDTELSRTTVSTATIAVKAARDFFQTLNGRNILVLGASGKIGTSVYKNMAAEPGTRIHLTSRRRHLDTQGVYYEIPYEERYTILDDMDVIVSATASPHYTLTAERVVESLKTKKPRVFIDLAVPPDLDPRIAALPEVQYYNMDDFLQIAEDNNQKKMAAADVAVEILNRYQNQFEKWRIFQQYFSDVQQMTRTIGDAAKAKGMDKALNQFFYALREEMTPEGLEVFMRVLKKVEKVYEKD